MFTPEASAFPSVSWDAAMADPLKPAANIMVNIIVAIFLATNFFKTKISFINIVIIVL